MSTIRFQVLYVFLVLAHDRRRIIHFNVTRHPTAEWTGEQLLNSTGAQRLAARNPAADVLDVAVNVLPELAQPAA